MGGSQVQVVEKRRKLPDLGGIDMRMRPLIERMLQPDPANRPDSMNAVAAMISGASAPAGSGVVAPSSAQPARGTKSSRRMGIAAAASILVVAAAAGTFYVLLQPTALAPPSAPPALQGGVGTDMVAPGAASPPRIPGDPAKQPAPQSKASLNPPAAPALQPGTAGQLSRIRSITQYVNDYDGGECFFVTPISVGETAARIEGYGASVAPFQTLDSDFKKTNGFEADIGIRQVTAKQCPAITFLGQLRAQRNAAPQLDIGQTNLRSGGVLTGTIDGYGDRNVELVLVSDDGSVNRLTSLIKTNADRKSFNLRMQINGASTAQPQILMAIVTAQPLNALQTSQPADASQVFPAALAEAARKAQTIGAAARYFKLE
jgi:serine/threonine-protein kinase